MLQKKIYVFPLFCLLARTSTTEHAHLHRRSTPAAACVTPKPHPTGYFNTNPTTNTEGGIPLATLPDRNYTLVIPPTYDGTKALPLILSYHGHGSTADKQSATTSWSPSAGINTEYIVAYPNGLPSTDGKQAWQGASYAAPGVDDLGFTDKLLDYLTDSLCVDTSRIYANGKSNGGGFVDTLACSSVGRRFAAFSAASGAFYTDLSYDGANSCNATKEGVLAGFRAPWMETHGSADTVIYYEGRKSGGNGATPAIPKWLSWWARRNGCAKEDEGSGVLSQGGALNTTTWECGGNEGVVKGFWVEGMGHFWPGEKDSHNNLLDASRAFLEFFGNWTLER